MATVTAIKTFEHNGIKKRGDVFEVSETAAKGLKRARLVEFGLVELDTNFLKAGGQLLSASLPARVSRQTTGNLSDNGEKKRKGRPKKGAGSLS